jgi:hypothetical protein
MALMTAFDHANSAMIASFDKVVLQHIVVSLERGEETRGAYR